ncbi:helix-turn-helix transcriptional regulator [Butyrivibrio sp. WCE2006]|uniref:helix-turn-helix transcriptional regulator n=1 Tax=Butyrivibrio sp. WCE2006 TaxID=1410611 RepID=UPI0005D136E5|nr:helix-turn-helix transcriptional regulator [Butyrivibrio sp. WCE2006]
MSDLNNKDISYEVVHYHTEMPFKILNIHKKDLYPNKNLSAVSDVLDHWHNELEIVYSYSNDGEYYTDGIAHYLQEDLFIIVNSQSIHKVISNRTTPYEKLPATLTTVLQISDSFLRNFIPNFDELYFRPVFKPGEKRPSEIMKDLSQYADGKALNKYENMRLIGLVHELLYYICKDDLSLKDTEMPEKSRKNSDILRKIISYTEENYYSAINEMSVADAFGYSASYFSRFFKSNMGITYKEFLTRMRVNAAKDSLSQTHKSVLEIAMDCGFSDSRGLINMFNKYEGITPLQYRKKFRKTNILM